MAFLQLAFVGCGRSTPPVAPVNGKVRLNGKPLTTGNVVTMPASGRGAHGVIDSDGSFALRTFGNNDGALLGMHKVAVVAYEAPAGASGPEAGYGKRLVPKRYTNPETSGLSIDVKSDDDNFPVLELKSP